jgi:hypothetical protein
MLRTYPAFMPCSATSQNSFPIRPSPNWRAAWVSRLPSSRFEQRISGQRKTNRKRELDRRVEEIFLKRVNDLMLHFVIGLRLVKNNLCSPTLLREGGISQVFGKATALKPPICRETGFDGDC